MKTQNKMRSEFEKLEEIARMVACDAVEWCDVYNWYRTDNTDATSIYHISWLNGAWYAFQEKQKEINAIKKYISELNNHDELIAQAIHDDLMQIIKDGEYK